MKAKLQNKSVTLMFPLYKDKKTVRKMIINSLKILKKVTKKYEIIAVDDGCPEKSGDRWHPHDTLCTVQFLWQDQRFRGRYLRYGTLGAADTC